MALKRVLVLAVAAAFITGCGGSSSSERASKAIREAGAIFRSGPNLFPQRPGSTSCRIPAGGVTSHYVAGTCTTRVSVGKDGSAVVKLVETWGNGAASHTWQFTVSPDDHVTDSGEHGDVPPQNAV
jgi:hypothetical protein